MGDKVADGRLNVWRNCAIIESIEQNSQNVYRHTPVDEGIVLDENIISQVDTIMRYAAVSGNCGICGLGISSFLF